MDKSTKENKEKLKNLERDIKVAFKENHFDDVQKLADEIKAIDPENHLAVRLLEKMEQAKADAKKRENAAKIKEYQTMLGKMLKEGNLENVRKLADELKEFDPKSAGEWIKKAEDAEAKVKQKQNADKIKVLEKDLKRAFKENRFEEVRTISDKIKEFDPQNKTVIKIMANIDKAKAEARRRENADQINALQDQIKIAFKENRFDDLGKTANKLFEIDPENKFAKKYLAKSVKAKEKAGKPEAEEVKAVPAKAEETKESFFAKMLKKPEAPEKAKPAVKTQVLPMAPRKEVTAPMPAAAPKPPITSVAPKPPVTTPIPPVAKVPAAAPSAPKPPVTPVAPVVKAPVTPAVPVAKTPVPPIVPVAPKPEPLKTEAMKPAPVTEEAEAPSEDKGNIFTRMFGKKEETPKEADKSIIDTILAKTTAKKAEGKTLKMKKPEETEEGLAFAKFGKVFLQFAVVFILVTAAFFYVETVDKNNTVLGFFEKENYAIQLHQASLDIEEKTEEERVLNREIEKFRKGYDNKYETIIDGIIGKRVEWSDMITKVNEVANAVYERNEISQYIKFSSYSFNAETGQVNVSGELSDPLGKNLTKLVELEEAFKNYPRDPNNPDDTREPYFYDFKEFNALSKSFNRQTGKYTSSFSLSFSLKKPTK